MKHIKNEQGAALVLTIMIITLILVFILMLFYQITNTTRQVTTIEKQLTATHIAEMGVDYYQEVVDSTIPSEISDLSEITLPELKRNYGTMDPDGEYVFEIINPTLVQVSESLFEIEFSVRGSAAETEKLIENIKIPITIQIQSE